MRAIKTFIIGSRAFFSNIEGYESKDIDQLCIMDEFKFRGNVLNGKIGNKDIFFFRNLDKEGFIQDALDSNVPMRVGKFLVPEFAEYLGLTIDDLKRLQQLIDDIDDRHLYEREIYKNYIKNGGFYLTDEQRDSTYKLYKLKRK